MIETPDLAFAGLAAGTLSAFVCGGGLWRSRRLRSRQRQEIAGLQTRLDDAGRERDKIRTQLDAARGELDAVGRESARAVQASAAEVAHLAKTRIPAEATRAAHPRVRVPGPLDEALAGSAFGDGLQDVLAAVPTAMAQERKRVDAAARAAIRGATRDVQAGLYRLQDQLRSLQQRYDDPELARILFALDHENEQSLRRAQVTAVVCGAWVGLAREESHLVEAVTGGQSRLAGYHRVRISNHLEDGTALVSHAVEPVAIITAELLDNALRHSAPDTDVVVNLERVHHGVAVTVDDAGVGMAADERAWAQRMVAGSDPILLSELGDPPRMGLAAIGQLTRRFDLSVDLSSPSPYGGVRAVLLIRNHLLSRIDPEERPPAASTPRSTRQAAAAARQDHDATAHARATADADSVRHTGAFRDAGSAAPAADGAAVRPNGVAQAVSATERLRPDAPAGPASGEDETLPRRRRRVRAAAPGRAAVPLPPARTPEEAAAALGVLQSGTAAARSEAAEAAAAPAPGAPPVTADADAPAESGSAGAADAGPMTASVSAADTAAGFSSGSRTDGTRAPGPRSSGSADTADRTDQTEGNDPR
jgi:signal transduction histidine kinase